MLPILTAEYTSSTNAPFTHSSPLPELVTNNVSQRITYLAALRKETAALQERINTELTQRMDDDKAAAGSGADAIASKKQKTDDLAEEENYGEEVVEED